jgi:hypothetical protein
MSCCQPPKDSPPGYYTEVPKNTAALPRTRPAPEGSAATFGTCDWSQGVEISNGAACPKGWTFNAYSQQCEKDHGKYSCAPQEVFSLIP